MAQQKTFIGLKVSVHREQPKYSLDSLPIRTFKKLRKRRVSLKIPNFRTLQLQLQLVRNQGDELRIRGFALGVGYGVAEEPLQGVQIPSIPGHFNGVADGPLHPAGGGGEGFGHLGIQYLGDGVRVPDGPRRGYQEQPKNKGVLQTVYRFICWSMHRRFIGLVALLY